MSKRHYFSNKFSKKAKRWRLSAPRSGLDLNGLGLEKIVGLGLVVLLHPCF